MHSLLQKLHLTDINPGACTGPEGWLTDAAGAELVSLNPATQEPLAKVRMATKESYEAVVRAASEAFKTWRTWPAPRRGLVVRDLGNLLREYREPLGELVTLEMGKIRAEGVGEVQEMIDICDFAVGLARQLYGVTTHSERPGHRMYEQWHPLGPIGIITAFNFPVAVWSWNAAIAAICGDTMVWKPSPLTPLTAIAVQHLCNRVMADYGLSGLFTLVIGENAEVGEALINDPRLPLVSFTGSVPTGRHVAEAVARRLGRSLLELGGNNGLIVTEDANLDLTLRAIVFGAVGTTGQRCTTTRRLFVHTSCAEALTQRLIKAYQQIRIGDPLAPETLVGPLVTPDAVTRMQTALQRAQAEGGEVLYGGEALPELGPGFARPAIVKMPQQTALVCSETFAPILYLMEYSDFAEVLAQHNAVPQGLSSALFTSNLLTAEQFLSASGSDCGLANVNVGTSGAEIGLGFGGEKETGGGRESGSDAWKAYMRRQSNVINWSNALPLAQGIQFGD